MENKEVLKEARKILGLSQSKMSEKLSMSVRTYQGYEHGRPCPGAVIVAVKLLLKEKENEKDD